MIAVLSLPVLAYQALFVVILLIAARLGPRWLNLALAGCLLWTATHVFFVPLAVLQATVILTTYFILRGRVRRAAAAKASSAG